MDRKYPFLPEKYFGKHIKNGDPNDTSLFLNKVFVTAKDNYSKYRAFSFISFVIN